MSDPCAVWVYKAGLPRVLHQSPPILHPGKMTSSLLAQQLTDDVTISRKRKPGETSNSPVFKKPKLATPPAVKKPPSRLYSDSLASCVKTFCCECDQAVNLSGLRKHINHKHKYLSIMKYKELYGDPKRQIIQMVYHTCAFCKKDIVNDYVALLNHMKAQHKTSMAKYSSEHMTKYEKIAPRPASSILVKPTNSIRVPSKSILRGDLVLEDGTKITTVKKSVAPTSPSSNSTSRSTSPTGNISPSSTSSCSTFLSSTSSFSTSSSPSSSPRVSSPSCSPCSRVFRSNMELKMHKRRVHV